MSRYALAILDNPKLEAMWPFQQNLTISEGGIMVHLNPFLCPSKISPLVNNVLRWNKTDSKRSIDISDTSNGNAMACKCREESSDRVKKNQFYFVHAMLYLTEEEGNNVQQHSIQHRNCILWISFNIKSESEMVSLFFTVCFGIV